MKGISNEKPCKCKKHHFILRPFNENIQQSKKVNFCLCEFLTKNARKKVSPSKPKCVFGFPILNKDKNYSTPAFILETQKEHFIQNRNLYFKQHARKVRQYEYATTDLQFPAPRSNYDYCNVCCTSYTDYIQHIDSFDHHRQIKMNKFNDYILDMEQGFKNKQKLQSPKRNIAQRCINIDEESNQGSWGHKKLKSEEKTQTTENVLIFSQNQVPHFKPYYQFNKIIATKSIINSQQLDHYQQIWPLNGILNFTEFGHFFQFQLNPLLQRYHFGQHIVYYQPQNNYYKDCSNPYGYSYEFYSCLLPKNAFIQNQGIQVNIQQNEHRYGPTQTQTQFNQYQQQPVFCFNNVPFYPY